MMKMNKIFDDEASESLRKQIREVNIYLHKELDKEIIKQLLLKALERNLLPILEYPEREQVLPMHYSKKRGYQINIHLPIPKLVLYSVEEFIDRKKVVPSKKEEQRSEFTKMVSDMKERVEKYGQ